MGTMLRELGVERVRYGRVPSCDRVEELDAEGEISVTLAVRVGWWRPCSQGLSSARLRVKPKFLPVVRAILLG